MGSADGGDFEEWRGKGRFGEKTFLIRIFDVRRMLKDLISRKKV